MGSPPLPPKKDVALALLANSSVFVHLDPRGDGVVVPPWFKKQPQLVLQIGLNMAVPIPDLHLDDQGMSCTLSFNRAPFHCTVPWSSVYAMVDDEGAAMVWPDEVPPEIQAQVRAKQEGAAPAKKDGAAAKRPRLEGVKGGPEGLKSEGLKSDGLKSEGLKTDGAKRKKGEARPAARIAAVRPESEKSDASRDGAEGSTPDVSSNAGARTPAARPAPASSPGGASGSPAPGAPGAGSGGGASPNAAQRKPKRELPPYLRVVK